MATYRKIGGEKEGSFVFAHDGYMYSKHKDQKRHYRLRSVKYKKILCKAFATLQKESDTIVTHGVHSHQCNELDVAILDFRNHLKRKVKGSLEPIKTIYDAVSAHFPPSVIDGVPFNAIKSTLYKCRKRGGREEEANVTSKCCVCLGTRHDTWALRPCNHASFCGSCSEEIVNRGQNCPLCRGQVTEKIRIFVE